MQLLRKALALVALIALQVLPHPAAYAIEKQGNPEHWPLWLATAPANDMRVPALDLPQAGSAAPEPQWLERWGRQPPAIAWNDVAIELVVKYQQNPLRATRALALLHASMHDALVLCARAQCDGAATRVALHAAAGRTLAHLYPQESPGRFGALSLSAVHATLVANPPGSGIQAAWRMGHSAGHAAQTRALDDGADLARDLSARPLQKPGVWRAAPPINIHDPTEPRAGQWRPWALRHGAEIEPPPPIEYGSPPYWAEVEEVQRTAATLTPRQKKIAEDWNLDLGSITPAGVWNRHARRAALEGRLDVERSTRLFAALNAAMMDAFIACWHTKYKWWTQRPVSAIRDKYDAAFLPHIVTPPFPAYVSGHASASGAASVVLGLFFPEQAEEFRRSAEEAALSRLYGGIHFSSDNIEGLKLGQRVGARVAARMQAR